MSDKLGIDFYLIDPDQEAVALSSGVRYVFGRNHAVTFPLVDTLASREHCELTWNDQQLPVLRDLGSRNGTYVNGLRIDSFVPLQDRDLIQIGGTRFTLRLLPSGSDTNALCEDQHDLNKLETFELGPENGLNNRLGATFSGRLREQNLAGLLRFFSLTDKTGLLILDTTLDHRIWFIDGTPRHALCGERVGLDALDALLHQPGETFAFLEGEIIPQEQTIHGDEADVLRAVLPPNELVELGIDANDLAKAEDVQKHLLGQLPEIPGYDIGLFYKGRSGVSGDLYDIGRLADGRLLIVLADVSGHGIQAALVVTNLLKTLRMLRGRHSDLVELMRELNDSIHADLISGQFLTAFAAVLDPGSGVIEMILAGHHQALLLTEGPPGTVGRRGLGLGLVQGPAFTESLNPCTIELPPEACLVQYTDGISEVRQGHEEFGEAHLLSCLAEQGTAGAQHIAETLAAEACAFADTIEDDQTVLVLKRLAGTAHVQRPRSLVLRPPAEALPGETLPMNRVPTDEDSSDTDIDSAGRSTDGLHGARLRMGIGRSPSRLIGTSFGATQLREQIDIGPNCVIYRGHHATFDSIVAVHIRAALPLEAATAEDFLHRATVSAKVQHTNVLQIIDAGYDAAQGLFWLTWHLTAGGNLVELLEHRPRAGLSEFLTLSEAIAGGLSAIHKRGLVHGDLCPERIRFDEQRVPKIADLGVPTDPTLADPYRAPECGGGAPPTAASDVYTLARLALVILGFTEEAVIEAITAADICHRAPGLHQQIAETLCAALSADPKRRPTSAELHRCLKHAQSAFSGRIFESVPAPALPPPQRRLILLIGLIVLCLVLTGILVYERFTG